VAVHNDQHNHRALSLAPSRAPLGASESAPKEATQPAPRADPPGASVQRDMPARVRPDARDRVQGDCREHGEPRGGSPRAAAQSAGTRKPARGATDGDTRWRRGHMHFSPERALVVRRAPARPEWSVASDAEGGTRRAGRAVTNHPSNRGRRLMTQPTSWWT